MSMEGSGLQHTTTECHQHCMSTPSCYFAVANMFLTTQCVPSLSFKDLFNTSSQPPINEALGLFPFFKVNRSMHSACLNTPSLLCCTALLKNVLILNSCLLLHTDMDRGIFLRQQEVLFMANRFCSCHPDGLLETDELMCRIE